MVLKNLHNIDELIEKYNNATTTLNEEAQLQAYFNSNNVAPHLQHYKPLFQYFANAQQEQYAKTVPLNTKNKRITLYKWISVAAIIALTIGIITPNLFGPTEAEKQEAQLVYNQTKEAFKLLSVGMNKGKQELSNLALVGNTMNDGIAQANQLNVFNTVTNKILKNKQN